MKGIPVGIMTFVGEHGTDYGYLCAGVLLSVIPVLIVYLIFQRYFVEGMAGAVIFKRNGLIIDDTPFMIQMELKRSRAD